MGFVIECFLSGSVDTTGQLKSVRVPHHSGTRFHSWMAPSVRPPVSIELPNVESSFAMQATNPLFSFYDRSSAAHYKCECEFVNFWFRLDDGRKACVGRA